MYDAADSLGYHISASQLSEFGVANVYSVLPGSGISDLGFPVYLSVFYSVFGEYVIMPRLMNAFLGAWTVVLIYRMAKRNFGENVGQLAGIMAMLMPNLIYYCGVHLKETVMIFIVLAFLERADVLLRGGIKALDLLLLIGLGAAMFFFRTVLAASLLFALFSMVMFSRQTKTNWQKRIIIGLWIIVTIWTTFSSKIQSEFLFLTENMDSQAISMGYRANKAEGNRLASYGSAILFAPVMFIAPFPTFINIEKQNQQMMLSGSFFVKNILAFFVLVALVDIVRKRQFRKYILILSFIFGYLAILAQSSFALSERFHLPALPFIIILAAYGLSILNFKSQKYYVPYLVIIVLITIAWNAFKLAGRGMI